MTRGRTTPASLVVAILIALTGCLSGRGRPENAPRPRPCTYHVSRTRNVPSMSFVGAPYRAVVTATVRDSAGRPLPSTTIARMPGGPGAYADDSGRAMFHLSARDVARRDSTNIMVRRIGYVAIGVPVRVAAGDSIDIVASMCPWGRSRADTSTLPAPMHAHAALGAGIGAVVGSIAGHLSGRGNCGPTRSGGCRSIPAAIGGATVGTLLGYAAGHLLATRGTCMPADAHSANMVASMRAMVDTSNVNDRTLRERLGIRGVAPTEVYLVTDERVCRRARQALDSLIHKYSPDAPGLKRFPAVYVVRAGNVVDVDTPGTYATNIFDATTWEFIGALITPD